MESNPGINRNQCPSRGRGASQGRRLPYLKHHTKNRVCGQEPIISSLLWEKCNADQSGWQIISREVARHSELTNACVRWIQVTIIKRQPIKWAYIIKRRGVTSGANCCKAKRNSLRRSRPQKRKNCPKEEEDFQN